MNYRLCICLLSFIAQHMTGNNFLSHARDKMSVEVWLQLCVSSAHVLPASGMLAQKIFFSSTRHCMLDMAYQENMTSRAKAYT
jgi:hypothetical protein